MNDKDILNISDLIGIKVIRATISAENNLVILYTNKEPLFLEWKGECCAQCFICHISGTENLIGSEILSAEHSEWKSLKGDKGEYGVIESMGTKIKTTKGYVDIETRLEHNGYYSGHIYVSRRHPRYKGALEFKPEEIDLFEDLKDF